MEKNVKYCIQNFILLNIYQFIIVYCSIALFYSRDDGTDTTEHSNGSIAIEAVIDICLQSPYYFDHVTVIVT